MLIFNTTFHVEDAHNSHFLIWIQEHYIPQIQQHGILKNPRLCRVLSHRDEGQSYAIHWEVEDSKALHRWHSELGQQLNEELSRLFQNHVVGFPTLMEVVE